MDRIRFNRLETLVQDLIDDVSSGYSQEMYDEDMRNLEEFIEQELDRAREEGRREAGDLYTKGHKKWKATIQPATKDIGNMKPYTN